MVDLGVVRCPVCEKVCLYRTTDIEGREPVKDLASSHLSTHRLNESKHGIYRVMIADHADLIEVETVDSTPIRDWTTPPEALSGRIESTQPNALSTN